MKFSYAIFFLYNIIWNGVDIPKTRVWTIFVELGCRLHVNYVFKHMKRRLTEVGETLTIYFENM